MARGNQHMMVLTAAGMCAGAAVLGLVEGFVPGTPPMPISTGVAALAMTAGLLLFGRQMSTLVLSLVSPLGVVLIAYSLANTHGYTDGAALYAWPVLWTGYFFGRRATASVLVTIGVAHGVAIASMPPGVGYASRWLDVIGSMVIVAIVVRVLAESNDRLLARAAAEARVDELTGALNRRGLAERVAVELDRARRERGTVAVIAIDVDHFKQTNDAHGHDVGDRVLAHLAGVMRQHTRGTDIVARIGGDEFLIVLPNSKVAEARAVADRIRAEIAEVAVGGVAHPTISTGIAVELMPHDLQALVDRADAALYEAKAGGRDRSVVELAVVA